MENRIQIKEAVLNHFNHLIHEYEVTEYEKTDDEEFEYIFKNKATGIPYIKLVSSMNKSIIEVRHLRIQAVCLIKRSIKQSLADFIHLSVDEIIERILYIDIQGQPDFIYSSKLSNKKTSLLKFANNKEIQIKLITILAEVKLALHFSGLVYSQKL